MKRTEFSPPRNSLDPPRDSRNNRERSFSERCWSLTLGVAAEERAEQQEDAERASAPTGRSIQPRRIAATCETGCFAAHGAQHLRRGERTDRPRTGHPFLSPADRPRPVRRDKYAPPHVSPHRRTRSGGCDSCYFRFLRFRGR